MFKVVSKQFPTNPSNVYQQWFDTWREAPQQDLVDSGNRQKGLNDTLLNGWNLRNSTTRARLVSALRVELLGMTQGEFCEAVGGSSGQKYTARLEGPKKSQETGDFYMPFLNYLAAAPERLQEEDKLIAGLVRYMHERWIAEYLGDRTPRPNDVVRRWLVHPGLGPKEFFKRTGFRNSTLSNRDKPTYFYDVSDLFDVAVKAGVARPRAGQDLAGSLAFLRQKEIRRAKQAWIYEALEIREIPKHWAMMMFAFEYNGLPASRASELERIPELKLGNKEAQQANRERKFDWEIMARGLPRIEGSLGEAFAAEFEREWRIALGEDPPMPAVALPTTKGATGGRRKTSGRVTLELLAERVRKYEEAHRVARFGESKANWLLQKAEELSDRRPMERFIAVVLAEDGRGQERFFGSAGEQADSVSSWERRLRELRKDDLIYSEHLNKFLNASNDPDGSPRHGFARCLYDNCIASEGPGEAAVIAWLDAAEGKQCGDEGVALAQTLRSLLDHLKSAKTELPSEAVTGPIADLFTCLAGVTRAELLKAKKHLASGTKPKLKARPADVTKLLELDAPQERNRRTVRLRGGTLKELRARGDLPPKKPPTRKRTQRKRTSARKAAKRQPARRVAKAAGRAPAQKRAPNPRSAPVPTSKLNSGPPADPGPSKESLARDLTSELLTDQFGEALPDCMATSLDDLASEAVNLQGNRPSWKVTRRQVNERISDYFAEALVEETLTSHFTGDFPENIDESARATLAWNVSVAYWNGDYDQEAAQATLNQGLADLLVDETLTTQFGDTPPSELDREALVTRALERFGETECWLATWNTLYEEVAGRYSVTIARDTIVAELEALPAALEDQLKDIAALAEAEYWNNNYSEDAAADEVCRLIEERYPAIAVQEVLQEQFGETPPTQFEQSAEVGRLGQFIAEQHAHHEDWAAAWNALNEEVASTYARTIVDETVAQCFGDEEVPDVIQTELDEIREAADWAYYGQCDYSREAAVTEVNRLVQELYSPALVGELLEVHFADSPPEELNRDSLIALAESTYEATADWTDVWNTVSEEIASRYINLVVENTVTVAISPDEVAQVREAAVEKYWEAIDDDPAGEARSEIQRLTGHFYAPTVVAGVIESECPTPTPAEVTQAVDDLVTVCTTTFQESSDWDTAQQAVSAAIGERFIFEDPETVVTTACTEVFGEGYVELVSDLMPTFTARAESIVREAPSAAEAREQLKQVIAQTVAADRLRLIVHANVQSALEKRGRGTGIPREIELQIDGIVETSQNEFRDGLNWKTAMRCVDSGVKHAVNGYRPPDLWEFERRARQAPGLAKRSLADWRSKWKGSKAKA